MVSAAALELVAAAKEEKEDPVAKERSSLSSHGAATAVATKERKIAAERDWTFILAMMLEIL